MFNIILNRVLQNGLCSNKKGHKQLCQLLKVLLLSNLEEYRMMVSQFINVFQNLDSSVYNFFFFINYVKYIIIYFI